jgi:hypothetical protein
MNAKVLARGYFAGEEFKDSEEREKVIEAWAKGFEYFQRHLQDSSSQGILKFNLEDDEEAFRMAVNAQNAYRCIYEFKDTLRRAVKNCIWANRELTELECTLLEDLFSEYVDNMYSNKVME